MSADRAAAPSGVVMFLFTDVEGSTRQWETDADGMRAALAAHDEVLRGAVEAHGGWLFKHTGDRLPCPPLPGKPPSATTAYREDDHSADRQVMPMSFQVVGDLLPGAS